jgi:hypothetical protein
VSTKRSWLRFRYIELSVYPILRQFDGRSLRALYYLSSMLVVELRRSHHWTSRTVVAVMRHAELRGSRGEIVVVLMGRVQGLLDDVEQSFP